jgi:hypothetical protein
MTTPPDPFAPPARRSKMLDGLMPFLVVGGIVAAWFVMNRWVLPKLGVPT